MSQDFHATLEERRLALSLLQAHLPTLVLATSILRQLAQHGGESVRKLPHLSVDLSSIVSALDPAPLRWIESLQKEITQIQQDRQPHTLICPACALRVEAPILRNLHGHPSPLLDSIPHHTPDDSSFAYWTCEKTGKLLYHWDVAP